MLLRKRNSEAKQEKVHHDIAHALNDIRPLLRIEECALTLCSFDAETGILVLEAKGGCPDCELSVTTFHEGIETQLKLRVPQIRSVTFA
jgi:Fe-S cluster biogenesis protein NfuA